MGKAQYGLNGIQDRENFRAIRKETTSSLPKGLPVVATNGKEAQRSIDSNSKPDYREKLNEELKEMRESEMWQAGATVRSLRPERNK